MNNEELQAQLARAKVFKAEQIAEATREVDEAERSLENAERRLRQWSEMIPHEVLEFMNEQRRRELSSKDEMTQRSRLEASHLFALKESNEKNKGMLPPHAMTKSTVFGGAGALVGGLIGIYIGAFHIGMRSEIGLILVGAAGGVVGLFAGFEVFSRNFVVDESLGNSARSAFPTRDTAGRTYFNSSQD